MTHLEYQIASTHTKYTSHILVLEVPSLTTLVVNLKANSEGQILSITLTLPCVKASLRLHPKSESLMPLEILGQN